MDKREGKDKQEEENEMREKRGNETKLRKRKGKEEKGVSVYFLFFAKPKAVPSLVRISNANTGEHGILLIKKIVHCNFLFE